MLGDVRMLLPALVGWLSAALVGWVLLRMLPALPDTASGWRVPEWTLGVLCVLVIGALLTVAVERFAVADDLLRWVVVAVVGWGVANAAGWAIDVKVGGPASGMVAAVVLGAVHQGLTCRLRAALALCCGFVGIVGGHLLLGGRLVTFGVVVTLATGVAALTGALAALRIRLPLGPLIWITTASGLAWVGAWALVGRLGSGVPLIVGFGIEIVLASAVCGAATALAWRTETGVGVGVLTARYALVGLGVVLFGMGVSGLLGAVGVGPGGLSDLMDVGTTLSLGLGAWVALWPLMRGLAAQAATRQEAAHPSVELTLPPLGQARPPGRHGERTPPRSEGVYGAALIAAPRRSDENLSATPSTN